MESHQPQSNELVLWLKALDLPTWAKVLLVLIMAGILTGAGTILAHGLYHADKDEVSAATTLLAISLPMLLIVTALVFGTNGEKSLQKRSARVLVDLIPRCIKENIGDTATDGASVSAKISAVKVEINATLRGCIADYHLSLHQESQQTVRALTFSVELNVYKANVVFWLPAPAAVITDVSLETGKLAEFIGQHRTHCVNGAVNEGYRLNPSPVTRLIGNQKMLGLVFIKSLPKDFLLQAHESLYFAQDLAFFVRGFIDVESAVDAK